MTRAAPQGKPGRAQVCQEAAGACANTVILAQAGMTS